MLLLQKQQSPAHLFVMPQLTTARASGSLQTAVSSDMHMAVTHELHEALGFIMSPLHVEDPDELPLEEPLLLLPPLDDELPVPDELALSPDELPLTLESSPAPEVL